MHTARRGTLIALLALGAYASSGFAFGAGRAGDSAPRGKSAVNAPFTLKRIADVPLPGPATRFDYLSYDPDRHKLFIAHLAANEVLAFNTLSRSVVARVRGLSKVHGVLVVPGLHLVYASATGTNQVVAIDEDTFRELARTEGGNYPDGMAYAPGARKLYVSDEAGSTETVVEVRSNKRIATIPLGGEAGNSGYDAASGHIFVNVQTRGELVEIDPVTDTIVARTAIEGADHNHGLVIDAQRHVAFIACERNRRLLEFDLTTKRVIASAVVGANPDVMALDSERHLLYVASESGVVSVFEETEKGIVKLVERYVARRAHSIAVDPGTHEIYLPLENVHGRPLLRIMALQRH